MNSADRIRELLDRTPGPSPWYPVGLGPCPVTLRGPTRWERLGDDPATTGKIVLKTGNVSLCVLDMYNWVAFLGGTLLIWHQPHVRRGPTAPVELLVLDCDRLEPIVALEAAYAEMKEHQKASFFRGKPVTVTALPTVNLGVTRHEFPGPISQLPELVVLASSSAICEASSARMNLALLIVKPSEGMFELIPQEWFNDGQWDFGYQWATRVARDSKTGRVVGDGIRMGMFMLDKSYRQVDEWITSRVCPWRIPQQ